MTKKRSIGLVTAFTPEIFKGEYFTRIIYGIIDALRNTSYDLRFIMVSEKETEKPRRLLEEHDVDGLMFLTWTIHPDLVAETQREIPVVLINDYAEEMKFNFVYCNHEIGTRKALQYLIGRGYKKIGMLQGPDKDSRDAQVRYRIYRETIQAAGLEFNPDYFRKCEYYFEEDGYLKMLDVIHHSPQLPRAMFCFNDDLAIGALRALKEENIACPGQVAIIGYDGLERGKYVEPPLTSVRQPLEAMGREMVRILIQSIESKTKSPIQKEFQPDLIVRRSAV
jgi:LacI family transcriptional regulator/LacI family repressor for deo operon, udp, cdd, tsx, nupC, and nupG